MCLKCLSLLKKRSIRWKGLLDPMKRHSMPDDPAFQFRPLFLIQSLPPGLGTKSTQYPTPQRKRRWREGNAAVREDGGTQARRQMPSKQRVFRRSLRRRIVLPNVFWRSKTSWARTFYPLISMGGSARPISRAWSLVRESASRDLCRANSRHLIAKRSNLRGIDPKGTEPTSFQVKNFGSVVLRVGSTSSSVTARLVMPKEH